MQMIASAPFGTATDLAAALQRRDVSAVEVLDAYLRRIDALNPILNAIVTLDAEQACTRAREADACLAHGDVWGPLHGVPVTVKDSFETAGLRTTAGFLPLANHTPARDATVVARLRAAGSILLGKTNVPPLTIGWHTENRIFGRTNNPWHLGHTPGGSSGGAAAAVAAGLTALEVGSDLRGSIRVPAHFCGVFGLKPTEGYIPTTGHIPDLPGGPRTIRHLGTAGPLARSAIDLGLALRVLAGPDGQAWEIPPVPVEPLPPVDLRHVRVAWTDTFAGVPVTGETRQALARAAENLAAAGARVEQRFPDEFDLMAAWETWGEVHQAEVGSSLPPGVEAELARTSGARADAAAGEERGRARAVSASMRQYAAALNRRDALIGALERFLADWDVLLCPVVPTPAFAHGSIGAPIAVDDQLVDYSVAGGAYCTPFSLTGHPVVVVPIARAGNGLPIGMQVIGPRWRDMRLLAIAAALTHVVGSIGDPPFKAPHTSPPAGHTRGIGLAAAPARGHLTVRLAMNHFCILAPRGAQRRFEKAMLWFRFSLARLSSPMCSWRAQSTGWQRRRVGRRPEREPPQARFAISFGSDAGGWIRSMPRPCARHSPKACFSIAGMAPEPGSSVDVPGASRVDHRVQAAAWHSRRVVNCGPAHHHQPMTRQTRRRTWR